MDHGLRTPNEIGVVDLQSARGTGHPCATHGLMILQSVAEGWHSAEIKSTLRGKW